VVNSSDQWNMRILLSFCGLISIIGFLSSIWVLIKFSANVIKILPLLMLTSCHTFKLILVGHFLELLDRCLESINGNCTNTT
jgi:hypothetical protein